MIGFTKGQKWVDREFPNHGDIATFEVVAVGRNVVSLINLATSRESALLRKDVPQFTRNYKEQEL